MSYLLTFGLAPYFLNELYKKLKNSPNYVILFDESYNSISKSEQMDVHVRFWDDDSNCVITRYLDSQFLNRGTADQIFLYATRNLDDSKILQLSMDGPSVNLKFYRDYVSCRSESPAGTPSLVDIGVCGLHVVHGAFKTGVNSTSWKIDNLLRSLYYLFHDTYARRTEYREITGSQNFPLQFCATRWTEDSSVAERAIEIWPNICKYVEIVSKKAKSRQPTSSSYATVVKATNDPLTETKLNVFVSMANELNDYLKVFQTDKPMVPLLYEHLKSILSSLLEKVVVWKLFDENSSVRAMMNI